MKSTKTSKRLAKITAMVLMLTLAMPGAAFATTQDLDDVTSGTVTYTLTIPESYSVRIPTSVEATVSDKTITVSYNVQAKGRLEGGHTGIKVTAGETVLTLSGSEKTITISENSTGVVAEVASQNTNWGTAVELSQTGTLASADKAGTYSGTATLTFAIQ